ncbi:MAG: hypothetical protein ACREYF_10195 [Gammaproteobacteria bacterium]
MHFPDPTLDLDAVFLFEAKRKVQKDRTVSLNGVVYEVDAALVGQNVTLQIQLAKRLDAYANCFVTRHRPRDALPRHHSARAALWPCASKPERSRSRHGAPLMYRKHFAFTRFPFETELDLDQLFVSSALSEAHARLKHLLELRGILESVLGLKIESGRWLKLRPRIPDHWPGFTLHYRTPEGKTRYAIRVRNPAGHAEWVLSATMDGVGPRSKMAGPALLWSVTVKRMR